MIIIKGGERVSIDRMLKAYKKKVRDTKQIIKLKSKKQFLKPSVVKRKQKLKAIYIQKKFGNKI
tara:strand:+ start:4611 stop:4802 length:192 start_codon:yes stop_codon:yes gene_type:complete